MLISICNFFAAIAVASPLFAQTPSWSGDLRLRGQNEQDGPDAQRTSQKLRLRVDFKVDVDPHLKTEIRLATGQANNSTNQTLGDSSDPGMARRFQGLDLAYAEWAPVSFLTFDLGRFPQLHQRPGGSQILLDGDIALEGLGVALTVPKGDDWKGFANAGSAWVRENYDGYYSENLTDCMINWMQMGVAFENSSFAIKIGAGFMNFTALQGMKFSEVVTGGSPRGNSVNLADGSYTENYVPRELFADSKIPLGAFDLRAFIEHVSNEESNQPHKAWWRGVGLSGKSWSAQVAYAEVDGDAVPAAFTDSDFAGQATDSRGWVISGQWKFAKGLALTLTQFEDRKQLRTVFAKNYERTHIDLTASF